LQVAQAKSQLEQAYAAVGLRMEDPLDKLNPEQAPPVRQEKALWDEAIANLTRARQLVPQDAITATELEQIAAAERVAEARYASALNGVYEKIAQIGIRSAELGLARQHLSDAVVYAPFDGLIRQRHVAPGSYVSVGDSLVTIVRTSPLRYRGTMPERHAHRLAQGQEVRLRIESFAEPRVVRVTRISPAIDELSRALMFEAEIDNDDGRLRPGMFAEAEVVLDPGAQAIVVPAASIDEFAGAEKVWKVVDGTAQEQIVQTGGRRESGIEVVDGLVPGDVILRDAKSGRAGPVTITQRDTSAGAEGATAGEADTEGEATSPALSSD
jgi:RND family efflux transporter MFP subunit